MYPEIIPDVWHHLFDLVAEAQAFDEEWQQKVSEFQPAARLSLLEAPRSRAAHRAAITGPEHTHRFAHELLTLFYIFTNEVLYMWSES